MSISKQICVTAAVAGGAMLTLQGCGGGDGPVATTTPGPTTQPGPTPDPKTGLDWCEEVPSYYKITYSVNGTVTTKSATGQCLPSSTPGAYYTKTVKREPGVNDAVWGCWNDETIGRTNADAIAKGFAGACEFKDYKSKTTPGDVEFCSKHLDHHPAVCSPGPTTFWGACWSKFSENWKCIPQGDAGIAGYAQGNCKSEVLLETATSVPTSHFYDGACRFAQDEPKVYKCDTVTSYDKNTGGTCGQSVDTSDDQACFSTKSGDTWQCIAIGSKGPNEPCDWTLVGGQKEFYKGYCVFPQNKKYAKALDAHNLTAMLNKEVIV